MLVNYSLHESLSSFFSHDVYNLSEFHFLQKKDHLMQGRRPIKDAMMRSIIGRITFSAAQAKIGKDLRRLSLGAVKMARKPGQLGEFVSGMMEIEKRVDGQLEAWVEPDEMDSGGIFDVCDLRIWLEIARRANVPSIEGRVIHSISNDRLGEILPKYQIPKRVLSHIDGSLEGAVSEAAQSAADNPEAKIDLEDIGRLREEMETVLFDIPSSWMVRTHLSGSQMLKSLVGTGLMLKGDDTADVAEGVSFGAGWIQLGNHRMIDFSDDRFVSEVAAGHKPVTHYIARPWHQPGRFHEGEDLHRANSPLAGPGKWPAEWRVFVRNGHVTGVSNYYGWTGDGATPQNCWNAIEAAALAQRIIDQAASLGLTGRFMDTELLRDLEGKREDVRIAFRGIDRNAMHCTLDFLEGENGLVFLEAGPGHLPGGGGHPCAFAGQGVDKSNPATLTARCEGVALLPMRHVHLAEPSTWIDGPQEGSILRWEDANELALDFAPLSEAAEIMLAEHVGSSELIPEL